MTGTHRLQQRLHREHIVSGGAADCYWRRCTLSCKKKIKKAPVCVCGVVVVVVVVVIVVVVLVVVGVVVVGCGVVW